MYTQAELLADERISRGNSDFCFEFRLIPNPVRQFVMKPDHIGGNHDNSGSSPYDHHHHDDSEDSENHRRHHHHHHHHGQHGQHENRHGDEKESHNPPKDSSRTENAHLNSRRGMTKDHARDILGK